VHNPKLVKASAPLGAYFHPGGYSLSERERETAVIIINSKWHSAYPATAHERRGKEVGLPAKKIEAMMSCLPTSFADEREQIVYEMAICLSNAAAAALWGFEHLLALAKRGRRRPRTALAASLLELGRSNGRIIMREYRLMAARWLGLGLLVLTHQI
jgi:hypothetical protein